ncbi:MAG: S49 family peptidase, partial [Parachlamydiaceae bacterium]
MKESIFKSTFRRFFMVLATVTAAIMGITLTFILMGTLSSLLFDKELSSGETPSLTLEIQPNALGVRKTQPKSTPVILKIAINGVIGTEKLNRQKIEQILIESREAPLSDDRVKGIIITINSPGGGATDSDTIYHALKA